ncbi:RNA polymerase sigma-32 factor [Azospirillum agricola]|uniref:sigma-70 family RNA polymerase sigma factor n=1 Tax=Azospirillum agricola TaxID=1720247 RepID=UPI001AEA52B9|nr:sigma-70 family RNA polymerase sigma factor [Azospirillum agricola]MBP2230805.1 RNA polymerase sigma-32 factor [Azospirillum agricola]
MSDTFRRMARLAMDAPMLTRDEEPTLIAAAQAGNRRAADRVIRAHMRMAVKAATDFRHAGQPLEDLFQAGCVGLSLALDRFDPARGTRFATYAGWWARSEVQDLVIRNSSLVRIGTGATQKSMFFKLRRERSRLEVEMPEALPSAITEALAAHFGVPAAEVERVAATLDAGDWSLDAPVSEAGDVSAWVELLSDDRPTPEEAVTDQRNAADQRRQLHRAVDSLPDREREIVITRTLADEPATLDALGTQYGISKERVRQIEVRAVGQVAKRVREAVLA